MNLRLALLALTCALATVDATRKTTTRRPTATPEPTPEPETPAPVVTPAPGKTTPSPSPVSNAFYVHHDGYSLLFNCAERTAERWNYTLTTDKKAAARPPDFYFDPDVSSDCQQLTTKTYTAQAGFDRGHLVASAHMTDSTDQRHQSHYITNVVPQVSSFNRGIWERGESIEACYRNLNRIYTWGGIVYTDPSNDYFVESHGIKTPDFWWKVILTKDDQTGADKIISWYIPNTDNLGPLDDYIVSVREIEARVNDNLGPIPVPDSLKDVKAAASWPLPADCGRH
ncbi:Aste57867_15954 [Aphanomyces stellatus]|uniref:Endonuclease n=1 Tax=Aphanomyces stellatus TaxID=120398 RepID=A0A485L5C5_9STRA|nr:hypothetical protein As57867_015898 [Aphanomyces stellatus]VFT92739.1 Aste57867_15954 [Aphanomyces stellatus]